MPEVIATQHETWNPEYMWLGNKHSGLKGISVADSGKRDGRFTQVVA